jgi:hypothetical protein
MFTPRRLCRSAHLSISLRASSELRLNSNLARSDDLDSQRLRDAVSPGTRSVIIRREDNRHPVVQRLHKHLPGIVRFAHDVRPDDRLRQAAKETLALLKENAGLICAIEVSFGNHLPEFGFGDAAPRRNCELSLRDRLGSTT